MILSSHCCTQLSLLENITNVESQSKQTLSLELIGRKCTKCSKFLPLDSFRVEKHKTRAGSIRGECRACENIYANGKNFAHKQAPQKPLQCDLCSKGGRQLVMDHNHATLEVRGWLCQNCNRGLGCFGDDYLLLEKALHYLSTKH